MSDIGNDVIKALHNAAGLFGMVNRSYDPIVSNMPEWKCTVVEPDHTKLNDGCSSCGAKDYKRISTHEYECTFCGGKTYI